MQAAAGFDDYDYYTITNYRDNNRNKKDSIDWNGGKRTYDQHEGMDIALNPLPWTQMDEIVVDVVAAAAGIIVLRHEGEPDRNCTRNNKTSNHIAIQHADGHFSVYQHLKSGTLTNKMLGDRVEEGEYLAKPGSSGSSTAPHLHFDVRKPTWDLNLGNIEETIDPYNGTHGNIQSFWQNQPKLLILLEIFTRLL